MMYMPIWILYWFPFALSVNYIIKLALINLALLIYRESTHNTEVYFAKTVVKSLCFSIIVEIIGILVFYVIETNTQTDFYYRHYTAFSALAFFVVVVLDFLLNYLFNYRKSQISTKQRFLVTLLIVIAVAPYLFLMPSGLDY